MDNLELGKVLAESMFVIREVGTPRRPNAILKHPEALVTGNLKNNALRVQVIPNGYKIYVDDEIAPYVPFTNEKWISPKWKGAKNPNEGWWEEVARSLAINLAYRFNGILNVTDENGDGYDSSRGIETGNRE